jgi:hypothetical protein
MRRQPNQSRPYEGIDARVRIGSRGAGFATKLSLMAVGAALIAAIFMVATSPHEIYFSGWFEFTKHAPQSRPSSPEIRRQAEHVTIPNRTTQVDVTRPAESNRQSVPLGKRLPTNSKMKEALNREKSPGKPFALNPESIEKMPDIYVIPFGLRGWRILICRDVPAPLAVDGHTKVCSVVGE